MSFRVSAQDLPVGRAWRSEVVRQARRWSLSANSISHLECRVVKRSDIVIDALPESSQLPVSTLLEAHSDENIYVQANDRGELQFLSRENERWQRKHYSTPAPVWSMAWQDRLLLLGSYDSVYAVKMDPAQARKIDREGSLTVQHEFVHSLANEQISSLPTPGAMPSQRRIHEVAISSIEMAFLTLRNGFLEIWDTEKKIAFLSRSASQAALLSGDWNPHKRSQCVFGGVTGSIKLLDLSQKKLVAWQKKEAHVGHIRAVRWSPLMETWLASAGEDGLVHIWDLRFGDKPVRTLKEHEGSVTHITWSPSNCEVLATGGVDKHVRLWSLLASPVHLVAKLQDVFTGPFTGLVSCPTNHTNLVAQSLVGEVRELSLKRDFTDLLAPRRFPEKDVVSREVECLFYARDFARAAELCHARAEELSAKNQQDQAFELMKLCLQKDDRAEDGMLGRSFDESLNRHSYFLPPNFPKKIGVPIELKTELALETFQLQVTLTSSIRKGDAAQIRLLQGRIIQALSRDVKVLPTPILVDALDVVMADDFVKAIDLSLAIGAVFEEKKEFSTFSELAYRLVRPTIYDIVGESCDGEEALAVPSAITEQMLRDSSLVLPHLRVLREFMLALWAENPAKTIIRLWDRWSEDPLPLLASDMVRVYCNILLQSHLYDLFFIFSTHLLKTVERTHFSFVLKDLMTSRALKELNDSLTFRPSAHRRSMFVKDSLLMMFHIVGSSSFLPEPLVAVLPDHISRFGAQMVDILETEGIMEKQRAQASDLFNRLTRMIPVDSLKGPKKKKEHEIPMSISRAISRFYDSLNKYVY